MHIWQSQHVEREREDFGGCANIIIYQNHYTWTIFIEFFSLFFWQFKLFLRWTSLSSPPIRFILWLCTHSLYILLPRLCYCFFFFTNFYFIFFFFIIVIHVIAWIEKGCDCVKSFKILCFLYKNFQYHFGRHLINVPLF